MAGRIRTLKPEMLEDAIIAELSDTAFRLFVGMILLADDAGRLRADSRYLAGQIFWARGAFLEGSKNPLGALLVGREGKGTERKGVEQKGVWGKLTSQKKIPRAQNHKPHSRE